MRAAGAASSPSCWQSPAASCETVRRFAAVDPEIVPVHVDATDLYESRAIRAWPRRRSGARRSSFWPSTSSADASMPRIRSRRGCSPTARREERTRMASCDRPLDLPLVGLNLYPMFTNKRLRREARAPAHPSCPTPPVISSSPARAALLRALRRAAFHLARRRRSAQSKRRSDWLDRVGRGDAAAARRGRPARRLHVVADVRSGRLGLPPGPAGAVAHISPRWAVGPRSRFGNTSRQGPDVTSSAPYRGYVAGGTAAVGPLAGRSREQHAGVSREESGISVMFRSFFLAGFEGSTGLQPPWPMVRPRGRRPGMTHCRRGLPQARCARHPRRAR